MSEKRKTVSKILSEMNARGGPTEKVVRVTSKGERYAGSVCRRRLMSNKEISAGRRRWAIGDFDAGPGGPKGDIANKRTQL